MQFLTVNGTSVCRCKLYPWYQFTFVKETFIRGENHGPSTANLQYLPIKGVIYSTNFLTAILLFYLNLTFGGLTP